MSNQSDQSNIVTETKFGPGQKVLLVCENRIVFVTGIVIREVGYQYMIADGSFERTVFPYEIENMNPAVSS